MPRCRSRCLFPQSRARVCIADVVLDQQLDPDRPLVGHCWGAADCAVQAHLAYLPLFYQEMDLSAYPAIQEVIRRTHTRPAYRQVMGMG